MKDSGRPPGRLKQRAPQVLSISGCVEKQFSSISSFSFATPFTEIRCSPQGKNGSQVEGEQSSSKRKLETKTREAKTRGRTKEKACATQADEKTRFCIQKVRFRIKRLSFCIQKVRFRIKRLSNPHATTPEAQAAFRVLHFSHPQFVEKL
jgi:hypothetical protein